VECVHRPLTALPSTANAIALITLKVQMDLVVLVYEAIVVQSRRHLNHLHVPVMVCVLAMASATKRLIHVPAQR
jgi:hypothetical protein